MSVYQIRGHWHYRFTIRGVRYRKAIPEARTKRQAEQAEQKSRNEVFEKKWGEIGRRNFADFVENVYIPYAKAHKKDVRPEISVVNALLKLFGNLRLGEITPEMVASFQTQRASEVTTRKAIRSRATVNRDVAVLSAIFRLALRRAEVRENPVSRVDYYTNLPKRTRILSDEEEVVLLNGIKSDVDLFRKVEFLLYTGLRRSEMFKLQWRDIDFENNLIALRSETTKTAKPRRIVIFSNVRAILESLRPKAGKGDPESLIFDGTANRAGAFSSHLKEACNKLKIAGVTAHSLRHTYSTRCNRFHVDPFAQRSALGHAKLSQTADYTHQSIATFRGNFDGFEEHLGLRKDKISEL